MKASVALATNPYASSGLDWIDAARRAAAAAAGGPIPAIRLYGAAGGVKDVIDGLYASFPTVIAVTLCVVFCLLAASFGSLAVAARLSSPRVS